MANILDKAPIFNKAIQNLQTMIIKLNIIFCAVLLLASFNTSAQESIRNPWGMNQQQYELYENTSVSQLNGASGAHPNYGALTLPEVSYVTNQPDNGAQPTQGQFRFLAAPSHYLKDDPIVFPDQPGASHLHMFFGNTRADAYSEVGTGSQNDLLVRGASTVQGGKGANPSAYWIPALVDGPLNGCDDQRKIILPDAITVYYKTRRPGETQLIPEGLELIGGNLPQSNGHAGHVHGMTIQNSGGGDFREGARWGFYDPAQGLLVEGQATIPQSNPNGYKFIRAAIGFPQCFASETDGGFQLSSPNNLNHQRMLEDFQGWSRDDQSCPSSHPNRIPKIELLIDFRWPDDNDVSGWRLSSDMGADTDTQVPHPGGSLHGDILFAWNEKVQQVWKDECHDPNDPRNCSIGQTGTQWILDRIENTATINNMSYTGDPYLPDPYDCGASCPPAGTACNDNNPQTNNDVEDGNCNCAGTCLPAGTSCDDGNPNTQNDVEDGNCNCAGTQSGNDICNALSPPNIDGNGGEWLQTNYSLSNVLSGTINGQNDLSANFQIQWDNNYLYVFGNVRDNNLRNDSEAVYQDDGIEVYIDGGYERSTTYDANDHQLMFRVDDNTVHHYSAGQTNPAGVDFVQNTRAAGYDMEIRLAWSFIGVSPTNGMPIGIDIHVNDDDDGGTRDKKISWNATIDQAWNNPSLFNTMTLTSCDTPPVSNCDLLTNGDFSDGTTDWNRWNCDINEVSGACQITNIQQVDNLWNAAFAQGNFTLENGKEYEVSFDARSIQNNRTIRVKVGLNGTPWTNYNRDYSEIPLTTNNQRITMPFTMLEPTTESARLEFHVGTDLTGLVVDNIQLISLSDNCNNDCEQVQNGNFAGQFTDDWIIQNCQATNANDGINISVPYLAENPWNIAIKQRGFNYEQGKEYQISFKAQANAPRRIYVKAGKASADWDTYNYEPIDLTTALETHSFSFIMNKPTDNDAFLEFFLGESDANLFLGEVSVVETACAGLRELSNELITNYMIFPNPVSNILTVQFDLSDEYDSGTIRLFDLTGRTILEEEKAMFTNNQFQLNVASIPAGMYMLRLDVGGYFLTHKVVKY